MCRSDYVTVLDLEIVLFEQLCIMGVRSYAAANLVKSLLFVGLQWLGNHDGGGRGGGGRCKGVKLVRNVDCDIVKV